jgi:nucleoside-diphosphate-sugar epimerase
MQGCDTVFHCAAEKHDSAAMQSVNVEGTRLVMEVANELHVKFLCHLSSVGVVGKTSEAVVTEDSLCNPMNRYEETKLAAEEIVARGLDEGRVVVLRPTNIFGHRSLQKLLRDTPFYRGALFLKGNELAHMVYIEDVSAATVYCWQNPRGKTVEKFIVSSDEEEDVTYNQVQAQLAGMLRAAPRPVSIAAPRILPYLIRAARNGRTNPGNVVYSSVKLRKAGFRFPYGLQAGLRHAVSLIGGSIAQSG